MFDAVWRLHEERLLDAYEAQRLLGRLSYNWSYYSSQAARSYVEEAIRLSGRQYASVIWC